MSPLHSENGNRHLACSNDHFCLKSLSVFIKFIIFTNLKFEVSFQFFPLNCVSNNINRLPYRYEITCLLTGYTFSPSVYIWHVEHLIFMTLLWHGLWITEVLFSWGDTAFCLTSLKILSCCVKKSVFQITSALWARGCPGLIASLADVWMMNICYRYRG